MHNEYPSKGIFFTGGFYYSSTSYCFICPKVNASEGYSEVNLLIFFLTEVNYPPAELYECLAGDGDIGVLSINWSACSSKSYVYVFFIFYLFLLALLF